MMPDTKRLPSEIAAEMPANERLALFSIASRTDMARVTGELIMRLVILGLIEREAGGRLSLTDLGRGVLAALIE